MRKGVVLSKVKRKKQNQNKQTNKEINPVTLTVSSDKRSCFIKSKKKKAKPKQNKTKKIIIIKKGGRKKEIKKLIKMIMEAIIQMIS